MLKCFKCQKKIESAIKEMNAWEAALNAVVFRGGSSYGSQVYDSMADGIIAEIVICDDCLEKNEKLIRNIRIEAGVDKIVEVKK